MIFMLLVFCTPYTAFDEAAAYLADTESQMVYYYLTPLPDNGEACAEIPAFSTLIIATRTKTIAPAFRISCLPHSFYHPPK